MYSLKLKTIRDTEDSSIFLSSEQRFTASGYCTYWEAVDKTIKYADTILMKKIQKGKPKHHNTYDKSRPVQRSPRQRFQTK